MCGVACKVSSDSLKSQPRSGAGGRFVVPSDGCMLVTQMWLWSSALARLWIQVRKPAHPLHHCTYTSGGGEALRVWTSLFLKMEMIPECKENVQILLGTSESLTHFSMLVPFQPPHACTATSVHAVWWWWWQLIASWDDFQCESVGYSPGDYGRSEHVFKKKYIKNLKMVDLEMEHLGARFNILKFISFLFLWCISLIGAQAF